MATKQSRKTAKRKAKQVEGKDREFLIREAMRRAGGPSSRAAAERMSTEALRHEVESNKRYRHPSLIPADIIPPSERRPREQVYAGRGLDSAPRIMNAAVQLAGAILSRALVRRAADDDDQSRGGGSETP